MRRNALNVLIGSAVLALLLALGVGQNLLEKAAEAQTNGKTMAPRFEVDPMWPKPLPNHWILGMTIGVGIDSRDHVYIIHRGAATVPVKGSSGPNRTTASRLTAKATSGLAATAPTTGTS